MYDFLTGQNQGDYGLKRLFFKWRAILWKKHQIFQLGGGLAGDE